VIQRYSRSEMSSVWTDQSRLRGWLEVELVVCEELAKKGDVPSMSAIRLRKKANDWIRKSGGPDPIEVAREETITRHDVLAFTGVVARHLGKDAKWIHYGLTSTDVVDTAQAIQIATAGKILLREMARLQAVLVLRAREFKDLPTIGRTHGVWAEPTSFGLKFLSWSQECDRNQERLLRALEGLRTGKLSGAVGVNGHFSPALESRILRRLGLKREKVSTQVLPRDRHAELFAAFAIIGGMLERVSIEARSLARSEVGEVREGFSQGQKGSSAMPHKRNPIGFENLSGVARLLRSYAQASFENIALWHERDISHSSVERVILPDAFTLLDYALDRICRLIENLEIDHGAVKYNLELAGEKSYSGHLLLALVRKGVPREEAYRWVQEVAFTISSGVQHRAPVPKGATHKGYFAEQAIQHSEIARHLSAREIGQLCSLEYQLRHVSDIFREVSSGERKSRKSKTKKA